MACPCRLRGGDGDGDGDGDRYRKPQPFAFTILVLRLAILSLVRGSVRGWLRAGPERVLALSLFVRWIVGLLDRASA